MFSEHHLDSEKFSDHNPSLHSFRICCDRSSSVMLNWYMSLLNETSPICVQTHSPNWGWTIFINNKEWLYVQLSLKKALELCHAQSFDSAPTIGNQAYSLSPWSNFFINLIKSNVFFETTLHLAPVSTFISTEIPLTCTVTKASSLSFTFASAG